MPGCIKRYTDPSSLRKHVRTHGHYFRENEQSENSVVHSKSSSSQNNKLEQLSPSVSIINSTVPSSSVNVQPPQFQFAPLPGIDITHSGRLMQIPGFSSTPLLSSAILSNSVLTNTISTQTDGVATMATRKTLQQPSPQKVIQEDALSELNDKYQECPLDLSTSPSISSLDYNSSQAASPGSPASQEVREVVSPRWEVLNA